MSDDQKPVSDTDDDHVPLPSDHPVDVLKYYAKACGLPWDDNQERLMRAYCDEPVEGGENR